MRHLGGPARRVYSPITGEITAATKSRMKSVLRHGVGIKEAQGILREIKRSSKIRGGYTEEGLAVFLSVFLIVVKYT